MSTSMGGRVRRASNYPPLNAQAPVAKPYVSVCLINLNAFPSVLPKLPLFKSGQKMQKDKPHGSELHRKRDSSSFHHCSTNYFSHNSGKPDNLKAHLRQFLLACTMVSFSNKKLLGLFFFGAFTQLVSSRLYQQTIFETEEQVWTRQGMDLHITLFFLAASCSHTIVFHFCSFYFWRKKYARTLGVGPHDPFPAVIASKSSKTKSRNLGVGPHYPLPDPDIMVSYCFIPFTCPVLLSLILSQPDVVAGG